MIANDAPARRALCSSSGENGEFHTFVTDGPLFARPVACDVTARRVYVSPPELGSQRYSFATLGPCARVGP